MKILDSTRILDVLLRAREENYLNQKISKALSNMQKTDHADKLLNVRVLHGSSRLLPCSFTLLK